MIFCEEEEERTSKEASVLGTASAVRLANRYRDVFSGSSVLIILRQFVIKTFVPLYFFNKCRGVIRVACRHFEARTWTRSKQSSASWDMSQRFCRFYRLNPVSIKNKRSLESHFRSSLSQG